MARGRYPADRTQALTQIAAAVIGSAAAAQMVHRETANSHDLPSVVPVDQTWTSRQWDSADHSYHTHVRETDCRCTCAGTITEQACPEHGESAPWRHRLTETERRVISAARQFYHLDGDMGVHHELMAAVQDLEREAGRRAGPADHAFQPSANPLFGAAFGGGCDASADGTVCGWPRSAHREERQS